jgi:DHA1 family bicyclomycin/chloramphenicol resistance-like MFS transporter
MLATDAEVLPLALLRDATSPRAARLADRTSIGCEGSVAQSMAEAASDDALRRSGLSVWELVAMVAAISALNALAIDVMLPALSNIARDYALSNDNDRQLVIVTYLVAYGLSQLLYGPLTDAFGRRTVLLAALGLFIISAGLAIVAPTFELFLAARALQGVGAAATRVVSIAVVRDLTEGRRMAQVMSLSMTVFMIVPVIAPGLGQLILFVGPWRWIFGALFLYTALIAIWAYIRLPETLRPEHRRSFNAPSIAAGYVAVFKDRQLMGYMAGSSFVSGAVFGYITSAEQIFTGIYHMGTMFAFVFAAIALSITAGAFVNARLVMLRGARRVGHTMMFAFAGMALLHAIIAGLGGQSFWVFFLLLAATFSVFSMIASNFNALAMQNVARVAGSASAVYGAVTATAGAVIGGAVGRAFDGTTLPLLWGIAICALVTIAWVYWTERGRLFGD